MITPGAAVVHTARGLGISNVSGQLPNPKAQRRGADLDLCLASRRVNAPISRRSRP